MQLCMHLTQLFKAMISPGKKFSKTLTVQPNHLDAMQHVNNITYIQWLQEIASDHWYAFATPQMVQQVLWMVKRHEVDYHHQSFLHDELTIFTWTGEYTNVTWKRHYEIIRLQDNKKIITALSVWIPVDSITQKPKRIDAEMIKLFM